MRNMDTRLVPVTFALSAGAPPPDDSNYFKNIFLFVLFRARNITQPEQLEPTCGVTAGFSPEVSGRSFCHCCLTKERSGAFHHLALEQPKKMKDPYGIHMRAGWLVTARLPCLREQRSFDAAPSGTAPQRPGAAWRAPFLEHVTFGNDFKVFVLAV